MAEILKILTKHFKKQNKIIILNLFWKMAKNLGISLKFDYVAK